MKLLAYVTSSLRSGLQTNKGINVQGMVERCDLRGACAAWMGLTHAVMGAVTKQHKDTGMCHILIKLRAAPKQGTEAQGMVSK